MILIFSSGISLVAEEYTPDITLNTKSAVLMEPSTGKVLFEQNANERLAIASVTKVMTILLIFEALEDGRIKLEDVVTVSEHASNMGGSQVFLETNERQTVLDLLKSIVIASANDAAVAMAEFVAGSEESFVSMMNKKAADLGMKNSSFKNACGLDTDGHFSSAYDVALMTMALVNNYPQIYEYSGIWMDTITHKTARGEDEFGLTNTNKLIKWYNGATGLKTGSTSSALFCLSGTAKRDGLELIGVVLGSPTGPIRFQETMKMLDYGFANFKTKHGEPAGTLVGTVPVEKGKKDEVDVVVKNLIGTVIPKGNNADLEVQVFIKDSLKAPVLKGDKAGEIVYSFNNSEIGRSELIVLEDVPEAGMVDIINKLKGLWF